MVATIGESDNLPEAAPYRHARQKYPWKDMKPGQWFRFGDTVKPTSARVQAASAGNSWGMRFHVFAGKDGHLYCRRVDGLDVNQRFLKVARDEFGNPISRQAELHDATEPTSPPIGRGRVYGEGIPDEPMPGETIYYGGAGTVSSPDQDDVPFDGGDDAAKPAENDEI